MMFITSRNKKTRLNIKMENKATVKQNKKNEDKNKKIVTKD